MKFSLKNKIDLAIIASFFIIILTGAFLRFFKYFFSPETVEKMTYILIPQTALVILLLAIKIWRT